MFRTTLQVAHVDRQNWRLTEPLVWEGRWEYLVIRSGFVTDFASIPRPLRWVLDSGGSNSEAAVLHDAAWRESQRGAQSRVDPWHADGMFRRALRETGSTALARSLMWFAVRAVAMLHGRLGRLGPPLVVKVLQLVGVFVLGSLTALVPTIVAVAGLIVYWLASWVVAVVWRLAYERRRFPTQTNWPWPRHRRADTEAGPSTAEALLVILKEPPEAAGANLPAARSEALDLLEGLLAEDRDLHDHELDRLAEL